MLKNIRFLLAVEMTNLPKTTFYEFIKCTMSKKNYWLDLFTGVTWEEFKKAGAKISGFRETRFKTTQKIKKGDYLLLKSMGKKILPALIVIRKMCGR